MSRNYNHVSLCFINQKMQNSSAFALLMMMIKLIFFDQKNLGKFFSMFKKSRSVLEKLSLVSAGSYLTISSLLLLLLTLIRFKGV